MLITFTGKTQFLENLPDRQANNPAEILEQAEEAVQENEAEEPLTLEEYILLMSA